MGPQGCDHQGPAPYPGRWVPDGESRERVQVIDMPGTDTDTDTGAHAAVLLLTLSGMATSWPGVRSARVTQIAPASTDTSLPPSECDP
eukprot:COSAG01_NODE_8684_length_2697_cov_8.200154_4_plen_88_part_00